MPAKFLLVSILDLLLGLNFLSPVVLVQNLSESEPAAEPKTQITPFLLPAAETNYFPIRDWGIPAPVLSARSVVLYDFSSDKILFSSNADSRLPIASLTKLMTAVVVTENINQSDVITITKSVIAKSEEEGGGRDLYENEKMKASELLKFMLIRSSNVAAYGFSEYAGKNYGLNLVDEMNQKARELGMDSTFFTEAAGLDDQNSFSTSQDLVKLVKYSLKYPELYEILKTQKAEIYSIDGRFRHQIFNTNELLGKIFNIIGGKTGFTELAGGSIVLVTRSPDLSSRLIAVVLGSNDRFAEAETLINWAGKAYLWK
ncbi:MAG: serine hydrolase [Patescibacteria group bacterium]